MAGRTVTQGWDDGGARTFLGYPSGHNVTTTVDALGRPIALASATGNLATYGYRGQSRIATKSLAAGAISGSSTFDAAGRRLESVYQGLGGATVFGDHQSWSPRSLTTARTRLDDPTQSRAFSYDPAGRLTAAARIPEPAAAFPNNTTATVATIEQGTTFSYDPAQNLLARTEVEQGIADIVTTPTDSSGRNRPASVDGEPLAYDANGNLTARGDQRLYYDERNRLTRVTTAGGTEIVRYEYDVFDRRIRKMLPGTTEH
ncbi:MAG: hypothetical protein AAF481_20265, partial [Acidobacteriota bacterium]